MKITNFTIHRNYTIMCKLFSPETISIKRIVIGVHGFAGDKESSMLEKLAEKLVEVGTALICFDFPAHGKSPVAETMLTVENCKEDLLAVAEYIRKKYPDAEKSIFATSFGGYIALLCYDLLLEFKFVLRAPAVTMPELLLTNVLHISADTFKSQGFAECGFERKIKLPYSFYAELLKQENPLRKDYQNSMLIVHGDRDDIVPFDVIKDFSEKHSHIKLHIIEGANHRFKNTGEIDQIVAVTGHFLGI